MHYSTSDNEFTLRLRPRRQQKPWR